MPKKSDFRITKEAVDSLSSDREAVFWDRDTKGFGVRVKPGGQKTYVVQYRNSDGVSRRVTLGQHGKLAPREAEKLAKVKLGEVAKGHDPAEAANEQRKAMTVKELCAQYIEAVELGIREPKKAVVLGKQGDPKKASTHREDLYRINRHILPELGKQKVRDLTTAEISKFMRAVITGKTATLACDVKVKPRGKARAVGGATVGARTVGLLGGILSYAVSEGIIETNPCRGVKRPKDEERKVRLSPAQYKALGDALAAAEAAGEAWQGVQAFRLLALTGCRLREVGNLKWSEVDLPGQALRLTDTKSGESVRPLGAAAVAVLEALPKSKGYVFPALRIDAAPYGSLPKSWARIIARTGAEGSVDLKGLTPHGLRHAFASTAGDLDFTEITIAALLGHAASGVTRRYIHTLDSVLISAADRVAERISGLMNWVE